MKNIKTETILKKNDEFPEVKAIYSFYKKDQLLFVGITSNLRKRIKDIFSNNEISKKNPWLKEISAIDWEIIPSYWDGLVKKTKLINTQNPIYQSYLRFYDNYVYLAVNFYEAPFLTITNDTNKDLFYIGPFFSRFWLTDMLDCIGDLFKGPICESEKRPCERYKGKDCLGFCIKDKAVFYSFFRNIILNFENNEYLNLQKEKEKLLDNLEFDKSDLLDRKLSFLQKFYKEIDWMLVSKNLSIKWKENQIEYEVKNGLLASISEPRIEITRDSIEFRDNEILAYNKDQADEARIIFDHISEFDFDKIKKTRENLYKKLFESLEK